MIDAIMNGLGSETPFVVGLCGSQGSGKSTLAASLKRALQSLHGLSVAVLSIDDLYLTRAERLRLASHVHPLLQTRGVPGTHDVDMGLSVIRTLKAATPDSLTPLPRFDKSVDDRFHHDAWETFKGKPDVIILEGWCVGAKPQDAAALLQPINDLERENDAAGRWRHYVNESLANKYQALFATLNYLVLLRAPDFDVVFAWRKEQEEGLYRAGDHSPTRVPMTDAALTRFIAHYERLTRHILTEMPQRADLVVRLDRGREVLRLAHKKKEGKHV